MIDQLGGRKAIIAVLIVALGIGTVLLKGDIPANFEHLLEIVFGTFVIGNAANTVSAHINGASDTTESIAAAPIDLTAVTAQLQAVQAQNDTITQALNTSQQGIGYLVGYVAQQAQAVATAAPVSTATRAAANRAAIAE